MRNMTSWSGNLASADEPSPHRAEILDTPADHHRIRTLLRTKYGLRDWWIGLLQDTSRSMAVKLRPTPHRVAGSDD